MHSRNENAQEYTLTPEIIKNDFGFTLVANKSNYERTVLTRGQFVIIQNYLPLPTGSFPFFTLWFNGGFIDTIQYVNELQNILDMLPGSIKYKKLI